MNRKLERLYEYPWWTVVWVVARAPWVPWLVVLAAFLALAMSVKGQEAVPTPSEVGIGSATPPEPNEKTPQTLRTLESKPVKPRQFTAEEQKVLSKAEARYWQALYSAEKAQAELTALVQSARASCESSGGVFDQSEGLAEISCDAKP